MEDGQKILKQNRKKSLPAAVFAAAVIAVMIFRAFIAVSDDDEIFNIVESFRTILGNSYLVENWDFFQMGDSFLYPLLKVFYLITGSTDGVVLYTRMIYVTVTVAESVFVYLILKKYFSKTASYFIVLVYFTAVSLKLFNFWYDSFELLFQTLGLFLLFYYFESGRSCGKNVLFFAGVFHSMMVYSYPSAVLVVAVAAFVFLYLIVKSPKEKRKELLFDFLLYAFGIFVVFLIFSVFVLFKGFDNLFIFQKSLFQSALNDSGRGDLISVKGICERLYALITEAVRLYSLSLILCVAAFPVCLLIKKKRTGCIFLLLSVCAGCVYIIYWKSFFSDISANNMLLYISFYTPALLTVFDREERKKYRNLFLFIFIPSYAAGFAYGVTALNGYIKFSTGAKLASIVTFILMYDAVRKYGKIKHSKAMMCGFMSFLLALNIFNLFFSSYYGTQPVHCNTVETEGVFKGLIDEKNNLENFSEFQDTLEGIVGDGDKTITCGTDAVLGYLVTDLKPNTNYLFTPGNAVEHKGGFTTAVSPQGLIAYFEQYYGYSDIFVLRDGQVEENSEEFMDFINSNYTLVKDTEEYSFYRLKK